jgi:hypothetical protein
VPARGQVHDKNVIFYKIHKIYKVFPLKFPQFHPIIFLGKHCWIIAPDPGVKRGRRKYDGKSFNQSVNFPIPDQSNGKILSKIEQCLEGSWRSIRSRGEFPEENPPIRNAARFHH